ncbi:unnamed protein product [Prorocentrum cordatum]|uniref:Uncharacterized protein n=1 Tax=Prorocentrum cordatum TaxID=2364126 RepID=A0ABN9VWJ7_9DINO|nr:unnamed protein product [Polarella glacialis]
MVDASAATTSAVSGDDMMDSGRTVVGMAGGPRGPVPSNHTMLMLQCLFSMVFAAAALGLLNCLGFVVRSSNCCPPGDGYSRCEVWQDFRSMLSFLFGALVCCIVKNERDCDDSSPSAGKVQLDTCLL